jgi:hypothetical protein
MGSGWPYRRPVRCGPFEDDEAVKIANETTYGLPPRSRADRSNEPKASPIASGFQASCELVGSVTVAVPVA